MPTDRDAWTDYATREGLIHPAPGISAPPPPAARRSKYGARRTLCDGRWFDSEKEVRIYQELKHREAVGEIHDLRMQVEWPLHIMELWRSAAPIRVTTVGSYFSDFEYLDLQTGEFKVIDVKSIATRKKESYRLKKKLVEAIHGITIDEV